MKNQEFKQILDERISKITEILSRKAKEYSGNEDRLYNFRKAAKINGTTLETALWGMASKHLVSVIDLIQGNLSPTEETVDEKIGDMINYLILLEAIFKEKTIDEENIMNELQKQCLRAEKIIRDSDLSENEQLQALHDLIRDIMIVEAEPEPKYEEENGE